jgi:EpsI family protein
VRPHHQEVCYRAQGFDIRDLRHEEMRVLDRVIPVVRVHAVQASRSEPVTYWMTMGERITWSRGQRMAAQLHYGLRGQLVDGVLVRVSSLQADAGAGYRLHGGFLNDLVASLPPALVPRFIGAAAPTMVDRRVEQPIPRNT